MSDAINIGKKGELTFAMLSDELIFNTIHLFFENSNGAQINCHLKQDTSTLKHDMCHYYFGILVLEL